LGFQIRTGSGAQLVTTNFLSEGDFERANTDIEDEVESSEYYEEEVTDHEAMAKAAKELKGDEDTEDSDLGFYMPTVMANSS
jgi:hypothetical protein